MGLLLPIFSMYKVFCKTIVFLFSLFVMNTTTRDLNFAMGM